MPLHIIYTENAPKAVGPYSQAIKAQNLIFCSGQVSLNPISMKVEVDDIQSQTQQVFANIKAVLEAAGVTLDNVVKTTVFLKNMNDFSAMNEIYQKNFGNHKPARSTIEVARLPLDVLVEIECIAMIE